ncbi:MAG: DUF1631 family protein [Gammaproteobacteria bacterium]|nr:DUF1631 family protein [Gammaproteobacteria bacterium]
MNQQINPEGGVRAHMDKRRYPRYSVRLEGQCVTGGGQVHPCLILDLCMGGMFLELTDPSAHATVRAGDQVTVVCNVPGGQVNGYAFNARIARAHDSSIGLAFIAPDLAQVRSLIDRARSLYPQRTATAPSAQQPLRSLPEVIADCQAKVLIAIPAVLEGFLKAAAEEIFSRVDGLKNHTQQNAYFTALTAIKCKNDEFNGRFMASIRQSFASPPTDRKAAASMDMGSGNELTLMDEDLVEDWLASADIVCHVEAKNKMVLNALQQRLTHLYGRDIDAENNPFRPLIFSDALQAALKPWLFEHEVYQICLSVFRSHFVVACEPLYEDLNRILVEAGILPGLHLRTSVPKNPRPRSRPMADSDADDAPLAREAQSNGVGNRAPPAAPPAAGSNQLSIFDIVDDIETLREEILRKVQRTDAAAAEQPANHGERRGSYSVDELMNALDAIHLDDPKHVRTEQDDFLSQIDAYLQAHTGERRQFPRRERGIMDVGSRIFTSLRGDPQVSGQVKTWLKELEIPLMKLALKDHAFLMDRDHILRRIINNVSMLEVYGNDEDGLGDSAVCHKIDNLIQRIVKYRTGDDAQILKKALRELELLVELQNDAYRENFNEVVRGCLEEQPLLSQANAGDSTAREKLSFLKAAGAADDEVVGEPEFADWLARVHRLKLNNWILLADEAGEARRLKLAWVTKQQDRYVFVNLLGQKEVTLTDRQLAAAFMTGQAEALESANEPAMDRAQHAMLQRLHHQLIRETTHDGVTALLNRREFEKRLGHFMLQDVQTRAPKVLCCLDVVQFRAVNESCGSAAGDRLLREIADRLRVAFDHAPMARLGNDEFAILLDGDAESARTRMDRLQEELSLETFVHGDRRYPIALNVGLAPVSEVAAYPAGIVLAAEDACRRAKHSDKSVCVLASEPVEDPETAKALEWLVKVNEAIQKREVHLRYQPIVNISGPQAGEIHHSEILLSVLGDDGEPVSPQDFVLAAERFHRMPTLDRLIVQETFSWAAAHPELIPKTGSLAVNLSGKSLNDPSFLGFLMDLLRTSGVPVEHVSFEVTETAGVNSMSQASAFIEAVREAGCSFSLDDFGSGMSSYGYLKHLPVDILKIDGAFVRAMDKNPEDFAIVKRSPRSRTSWARGSLQSVSRMSRS